MMLALEFQRDLDQQILKEVASNGLILNPRFLKEVVTSGGSEPRLRFGSSFWS